MGYKVITPQKMKETWLPIGRKDFPRVWDLSGGFVPTEPARLGLAAWCLESQATLVLSDGLVQGVTEVSKTGSVHGS